MGHHYEIGLGLYEHKRFEPALKEFMDELSENPNSIEALRMVACCLDVLGKIGDALEFAMQAVERDPQQSFSFHVLGRCLYRNHGLCKKTVDAFITSISLDPLYIHNYVCLGYINADNNKWKEALQWSEKALQLSPSHARCLALAGWCNFNLGKTRNAHTLLMESLRIEPTVAQTHRYLAHVAIIMGDMDLAREQITEAHRIDPRPMSQLASDHPIGQTMGIGAPSSHDLMSEVIRAHGTLYARALVHWMRFEHGCKVQENRHGSLFAILLVCGLLVIVPIFCFLDSISHALATAVCILLATAYCFIFIVIMSLWAAATIKMMRHRSTRLYLTARQRKFYTMMPLLILFIFLITWFGVAGADKQESQVLATLRQAKEFERKGDYRQASERIKLAVSQCCGPPFSLSSYRIRAASRDAGFKVLSPDQVGSTKESMSSALSALIDASYGEMIAEVSARTPTDRVLIALLNKDKVDCLALAK